MRDVTQTAQSAAKNTDSLHDKQRTAILESLRTGATRTAAARAAGVSRRSFYRWLETDADFAESVNEAEAECVETVEGVAYECAMKAKSDVRYLSALIFFLKCKAKWYERAGEHQNRSLPGDTFGTTITGELAFDGAE